MKKIDMTKGNLFKDILTYFIPIALAAMLQVFYTSCDLIVVGRFAGTFSLAAVGSTNTLVNLLINLFIGLSVGSSITFARLIGEKKFDDANRVIGVSFYTSLGAGLILMIVGTTLSKTFLSWMDTDIKVIDKAALYMRIYFAGIVFNIMYNYLSSIVRAGGDSTTPLMILGVAGATNIVLNIIFVTLFKMDVAGVAVATIMSQALSVTLIIRYMKKEKGVLHFEFKKLTFDTKLFKEVVKLGIPSGIQSTIFSLSNVVIQSTINSYGAVAVAGNSASQSIESFVNVISNSLSQTAMNFNSQNYGARNAKRMRNATLICLLYGLIVAAILPITIFTFARPLLSIYTTDPDAIEYGVTRLTYHFLPFFLWVVVDCFGGANKGMKKAIEPMLIMLIGVCGIRLGWIYFVYPSNPSLSMVYISYPISWLITGIALVTTYVFSYSKLSIKFERLKRREKEHELYDY